MVSPLIIGTGNVRLRDDGLGVRAIETLRRMDLVGVDLLDAGTFEDDLAESASGRNKIIIVGAVKTGAEAGAICRLTPQDLAGKASIESAITRILLAIRRTGCAAKVIILGVEPKDTHAGTGLSQEISRALPQVVEMALIEAGKE